MADPSAFYEPEEEELLSSLSVPNYNGAGGYEGDQEYQAHLQELESHAFAQQGQDQEAALEGVPKDVKRVRANVAPLPHGATTRLCSVLSETDVSSLFYSIRRFWKMIYRQSPTCTNLDGRNLLR